VLRKREPEPLLVAPTPPPISQPPVLIDFATKRPSIHFELVEEVMLRPKIVFPDLAEDLVITEHFVHENEEDILAEEDPFSKLENTWGSVRQVKTEVNLLYKVRVLEFKDDW